MTRTIRALAISLALAASSCQAMPDLAGRAVDFNEAAAGAANQLILLNAVRASKREPLFYSRITGITTRRNITPNLSVGFPFGQDAREVFSGVVAGGVSNETLFSTEILDAQDFYNGIMQPVSPEILKFYLDAGWPQEMIYHLFVERLEVSALQMQRIMAASDAACAAGRADATLCRDGGVLSSVKVRGGCVSIDNDPRDPAAFARFQALLRRLEALGFGLETQATVRRVHYPRAVSATLEQVMKMSNVRVEPSGDGLATIFTERRTVFGLADHEMTPVHADAVSPAGITVVTRSADAALYYLGELVEAQLAAGGDVSRMPSILTGFPEPRAAVLFAVSRSGETAGSAVSVTHGGETYAIPGAGWSPGPGHGGHRSMQVIALMNQVFALHKKGTQAPSVVPVTVLN